MAFILKVFLIIIKIELHNLNIWFCEVECELSLQDPKLGNKIKVNLIPEQY